MKFPHYIPRRKRIELIWFSRIVCGVWYPRVLGWDFYGCWGR